MLINDSAEEFKVLNCIFKVDGEEPSTPRVLIVIENCQIKYGDTRKVFPDKYIWSDGVVTDTRDR